MRVYLDLRERAISPLVHEIFEEVEEVTLGIGDILLIIESEGRGVIIERKTVPDLVSSIRSNRLWEQLLKMAMVNQVLGFRVDSRILLIEGDFHEYLESPDFPVLNKKWFLNSMMGAMMETIFVYGIPVIQVRNSDELRAFLTVLKKREIDGVNRKEPEVQWFRKTLKGDMPVKDFRLYLLASIPTIGDSLASSLLDHFDTVEQAAKADVTELQKVPGIGIVKAEKIYDIFH